jgi:hypothetical protein
MGEAIIKMNNELSVENFRNMVKDAEDKIIEMGGLTGDALEERHPLKHSFGKGLYIREIFAPAGSLIITKIHRFDHPYFITHGICSVLTEEGMVRLEAPFNGMTKAGTKRAVYIHEDVTWITVHATDKTDLEEIEKEIIAEDFSEFEGGLPCHL